jgi:hypothetical protein
MQALQVIDFAANERASARPLQGLQPGASGCFALPLKGLAPSGAERASVRNVCQL